MWRTDNPDSPAQKGLMVPLRRRVKQLKRQKGQLEEFEEKQRKAAVGAAKAAKSKEARRLAMPASQVREYSVFRCLGF